MQILLFVSDLLIFDSAAGDLVIELTDLTWPAQDHANDRSDACLQDLEGEF